MSHKRILIMAGGTGGHVYPALAVAKKLTSEEVEIHWLGTSTGLEASVVPANNFSLSVISITGLRGKGLLSIIKSPFVIIVALIESMKVIRKFRPDAVLGMGGYVSGPGGLAAWILRVPLYIHEQNAIAGLTNRLLAPFAKIVMQGFPMTFPDSAKVKTTGNPVREEILTHFTDVETQKQMSSKSLHLLVLGGSLGARALNQVVPIALKKLEPEAQVNVWHQTGNKHIEDAQALYKQSGLVEVRVDAYIDDMAEAYAWADVVLCRAGALTLAELCVARLASILVPFPHAVDDHQTANARYLSDVGAAILLPESDLEPGKLALLLNGFLQMRQGLQDMAERTKGLAQRDASQQVAAVCMGAAHV